MADSILPNLRQSAIDCVSRMGDIFWDFDRVHNETVGFRDPREIAREAVEKCIRDVLMRAASGEGYLAFLKGEYEQIITDVPEFSSSEDVIGMLITIGEWSRQGATTLFELATQYGTAILRDALMLAYALRIEDGSSRL